MNPRAKIFEDDLSDFAPRPREERAPPDAVREIAEPARFVSREPVRTPEPESRRAPRRYRTGRNRQINIKASEETVERLYALSDANGWVLGETLERALTALARELAADTPTDSRRR